MSKTVDLWKNITVIFHKLCEKGGVAKKYNFVIFVTVTVQLMGDKKIENSTQIWYDVSIHKNTYEKELNFP